MKPMKKWLIAFTTSCGLCCAGVLLALRAMNGFEGLGLGLEGTVALVLGIVFAVALGVALMAAVFVSDRSDKDEEVHHLDLQKR